MSTESQKLEDIVVEDIVKLLNNNSIYSNNITPDNKSPIISQIKVNNDQHENIICNIAAIERNPLDKDEIIKVINIVHPKIQISNNAIDVINQILYSFNTQLNYLNDDNSIKEFINLKLNGELGKHAYHEFIKHNKDRTYIVEYLLAEILELVGNRVYDISQNGKINKIKVLDILTTIFNDQELYNSFKTKIPIFPYYKSDAKYILPKNRINTKQYLNYQDFRTDRTFKESLINLLSLIAKYYEDPKNKSNSLGVIQQVFVGKKSPYNKSSMYDLQEKIAQTIINNSIIINNDKNKTLTFENLIWTVELLKRGPVSSNGETLPNDLFENIIKYGFENFNNRSQAIPIDN